MAWPDLSVVISYLVILVLLGFWSARRSSITVDDYLLAGRSVTLPGFVVTLVSTWYGGILGVGEYNYQLGVSNWLALGFPYYVFALLFAVFLAPKIQKSRLISIPDQFSLVSNPSSGVVSAILTFFLVSPAPYALMGGLLLSFITDFPLGVSVLIAIVFSIVFVWVGGYRSLVITDFFQFSLMFIGFMVMLVILVLNYGGFDELMTMVPENHLSLIPEGQELNMIVWFFLGAWTLVDPGFYQRCYSAKTPQIAQKGILVSIAFWFVFDFLTTSVGLYARALLPNLENAGLSYPELGKKVLPVLLYGLFFTGLLATVLSTLNGFSFLSAQTIGRDIIHRLNKAADPVKWTKWSLLLVAGLTWGVASWFESIVEIWFTLGSVVLPALLAPMIIIHWKPSVFQKITNLSLWMVLTVMISLSWYIAGLVSWDYQNFFYEISPFYPGLIVISLGLLSDYWMGVHNQKNLNPT